MICYRDMTFCTDSMYTCNNENCPRYINEDLINDGIKWWGYPEFPLALSSFKKDCKSYVSSMA